MATGRILILFAVVCSPKDIYPKPQALLKSWTPTPKAKLSAEVLLQLADLCMRHAHICSRIRICIWIHMLVDRWESLIHVVCNWKEPAWRLSIRYCFFCCCIPHAVDPILGVHLVFYCSASYTRCRRNEQTPIFRCTNTSHDENVMYFAKDYQHASSNLTSVLHCMNSYEFYMQYGCLCAWLHEQSGQNKSAKTWTKI